MWIWKIKLEQSELLPTDTWHLAVSRLDIKVKVKDDDHDKNAFAKVVGATSSEGFLATSHLLRTQLDVGLSRIFL